MTFELIDSIRGIRHLWTLELMPISRGSLKMITLQHTLFTLDIETTEVILAKMNAGALLNPTRCLDLTA